MHKERNHKNAEALYRRLYSIIIFRTQRNGRDGAWDKLSCLAWRLVSFIQMTSATDCEEADPPQSGPLVLGRHGAGHDQAAKASHTPTYVDGHSCPGAGSSFNF